jgi:hypothetical protein
MKIRKLTKQFSGYSNFKYCVEFTRKDFKKFIERRNWCWEQWGPSCELEFYRQPDSNEHWCWITDQHRVRIYLVSESEATWYSLKWS